MKRKFLVTFVVNFLDKKEIIQFNSTKFTNTQNQSRAKVLKDNLNSL